MKFYLINNTDWEVPEGFLTWLLKEIAKPLKKFVPAQPWKKKDLGIVIVGVKEMTLLNKQFRGKKGPTDILSFESAEGGLGELAICRELVIKQAKQHKLHEAEELSYLLLHGILHLLGYDHEAPGSDAQQMFAIQDKIFALLQEKDILVKWKKSR